MNKGIFGFDLGYFECFAVNDGTFTYAPPTFPPPAMFLFSNASIAHLEQALRKYNIQLEHWKAWTSPYICLVIKTNKHQVLVDTGANGLGQETGKLMQSLQLVGISPSEIDTVIITHGHPDHLGGNTTKEGKSAFPNARFVIGKGEWDFWTSDRAESMLDKQVRELLVASARKNLQPIQSQFDYVDHEMEVVPGIRAIAAPGHTPGHTAFAVSSKGEKLLVTSDAFLHPIHVEYPEWHATIDLDPQQVVTSRRRLINLAINSMMLVLAFHFPFPGLGHITQKGERACWQPF